MCLHSQHDSKTESRTKILRRGVYSKTCCSTIHTIVNNCRHSLTPHNYSIIPVLILLHASFFRCKPSIQNTKTNREYSTQPQHYCNRHIKRCINHLALSILINYSIADSLRLSNTLNAPFSIEAYRIINHIKSNILLRYGSS